MKILNTHAFLTINNKNLDRNFTFKIIQAGKSLSKIARITIKKDFYYANKIELKKDDKVFVSIANNKEDKVLIFNGIVQNITNNHHELQIEAIFHAVENTVFNETYKDTNLEKVLKNIIPKFNYQAKDFEQEQIIVQGIKRDTAFRLLNKRELFYYIDKDNVLSIREEPKNENTKEYSIDNCLYFTKDNSIAIFPIPQLNIGDIVILKEKKFIVHSIVYHYLSRSQMILGV